MTYNGYANYETWAVNMWLSNDEATYSLILGLAREMADDEPYSLADAIKETVEEFPDVEAIQSQASFVADLFGAAFSAVDWYEIALAWAEDAKESV